MNASALPHYLTAVDLESFYGFSRPTVADYRRRGLIPGPNATYRGGDLWLESTLVQHRTSPVPALAAVVPIDEDLGTRELATHHAYLCPTESAHHIGWCAPAIIGVVRDGTATWFRVKAISRFGPGSVVTEPARASNAATAAAADRYREFPGAEGGVAVFELGRRPLGAGPVLVSARTAAAGLQRARLLRIDTSAGTPTVGAAGNWLVLSGMRSPLPEFTLPVLDDSWPR